MGSKIKSSLTAQELRIGSWVNYKDNPYQIMYTVSNVVGLDLDSETLDTHHSNVSVLDVQPIELTEQVLLKCGFNWISDTWLSIPIDNGWNICYDVTGYIYLKYNVIECEISHFKFEYLHQLQNLYFALTGRELEFKA